MSDEIIAALGKRIVWLQLIAESWDEDTANAVKLPKLLMFLIFYA